MEQQFITAKNNVVLAGMRLALITGAAEGVSLDTSEYLTGMPLGREAEDLVAVALANRKDLKELEKAVEKAQVEVSLAGSAYLPTLYGSAGYQMNDRDLPFGRDNDSWLAGVNLRWELFDGLAALTNVRALLESSARESWHTSRGGVLPGSGEPLATGRSGKEADGCPFLAGRCGRKRTSCYDAF
jgi:outer membrane protein TolC